MPKNTDSMECDGRKLNRFVLFVNHVLPVLGALIKFKTIYCIDTFTIISSC